MDFVVGSLHDLQTAAVYMGSGELAVVEETIQSSVGVPNKVAGRTQFYDPVNNISVVTENGEVVTVVYGRLN